MKKGFTLIELLAVIVILAIIALIATPIILGIINDAKEDSNKRSIENYAHAVELAVARAATKQGGVIEEGDYTIKDFGKKIESPTKKIIEIDYKGEEITGTVNVDAKGKIKLIEVKLNGSEKEYNYSEDTGVEEVKEKEISEEKDLALIFYLYNTMYNETQTQVGIIEDFVDDSNNDKKSDLNPELNTYVKDFKFDISKTDITETIPTSGNIKAVITHYDGSEEEITLTTTDNKQWEYIIIPGEYSSGTYTGAMLVFRPYTKSSEYSPGYESNSDYHYLDIGTDFWVPFKKITILGKTIEFPTNKQALMIAGNMATETFEPIYNDIDKVNKITINYINGAKKEYKRNQMYKAEEYIGESNDFYSSPSIPVLYTSEETEYDFEGVKSFIINIPYVDKEESVESIIVEENGKLIKYNVTDKTYILHGSSGS